MTERAQAQPRVTAVVLAFGPEPLLVEFRSSDPGSRGVVADMVLVDNGCATDGVEGATADHLAFVNGDAVVNPDAVAHMVRVLEDPGVGLVSASLRLHDRPSVMSSVGNPVHFHGRHVLAKAENVVLLRPPGDPNPSGGRVGNLGRPHRATGPGFTLSPTHVEFRQKENRTAAPTELRHAA